MREAGLITGARLLCEGESMTDSVRCVLRGCKKLSKQFSYSDLLRCSRFGLGVQSPLPTFEDGIGFKALVQIILLQSSKVLKKDRVFPVLGVCSSSVSLKG